MITMDQVHLFAKTLKTNEMTALREYLQYLFLSVLYSQPVSSRIYFKGGTAIHLIYHAPRFSEDLDFTVMLPQKEFTKAMNETFGHLTKHERLTFKERETITGKRYMMSAHDLPGYPPTFINLDFSFREDVLQPKKTVISSDFPIAFTGFVWHLSKEELYAEKIRAMMTRKKSRDLYDLWYLSTLGVRPDAAMVQKKLAYYQLEHIGAMEILARMATFSKEAFVQDLRPFVPVSERTKLPEFYDYVQTYLKTALVAT